MVTVIAVPPQFQDVQSWRQVVPPSWDLSSWWQFDMSAFSVAGGDPYQWVVDNFAVLLLSELDAGGLVLAQHVLWKKFTAVGKSVYCVRPTKVVVVVASRELKTIRGDGRAATIVVDDRPDLPFVVEDAPQITVAAARALIQQSFRRGIKCPCCTQLVKVYKRKLNRHMAVALAHIYVFYRDGRSEWLHVPTYLTERKANPTNEVGLLRHWGLLEEATEKQRPDGAKHAGYYRITPLGHEFVRDVVAVPKYIYLFDETLLGRSDDEHIRFTEAVGATFNFAELMAA